MELYEIKGDYPDRHCLKAYALVDDQRDAIAMAQGLLKSTTVRRVHVYSVEDYRCVYYDELKVAK